MVDEEPRHCDEYIEDYEQPDCLRWWLHLHRLTADLKCLAERSGANPSLYADYNGYRVRVIMASRMGDVGIVRKLTRDHGYDKRVAVSELSNFSNEP